MAGEELTDRETEAAAAKPARVTGSEEVWAQLFGMPRTSSATKAESVWVLAETLTVTARPRSVAERALATRLWMMRQSRPPRWLSRGRRSRMLT